MKVAPKSSKEKICKGMKSTVDIERFLAHYLLSRNVLKKFGSKMPRVISKNIEPNRQPAQSPKVI